MSFTAQKVEEAEAQLKILTQQFQSLKESLKAKQRQLEIANAKRSSGNRELRLEGAKESGSLKVQEQALQRQINELKPVIQQLGDFVSLKGEANRAQQLVADITTVAELGNFSQSERRQLSNESLKILAAAERAKTERIDRNDAERLKEQLQIEQAKATDILAGILDAAGQERRRKEEEAFIQQQNTLAFEQRQREANLVEVQNSRNSRIFELATEFNAKTLDDLVDLIEERNKKEADKLAEELAKEAEEVTKRTQVNEGKEENILNDFLQGISGAFGGFGAPTSTTNNIDTRGLEQVWRETNDITADDIVLAHFEQQSAGEIVREMIQNKVKL